MPPNGARRCKTVKRRASYKLVETGPSWMCFRVTRSQKDKAKCQDAGGRRPSGEWNWKSNENRQDYEGGACTSASVRLASPHSKPRHKPSITSSGQLKLRSCTLLCPAAHNELHSWSGGYHQLNNLDASNALENLNAQTIRALYPSVRLSVKIYIEWFVCVLKALILVVFLFF